MVLGVAWYWEWHGIGSGMALGVAWYWEWHGIESVLVLRVSDDWQVNIFVLNKTIGLQSSLPINTTVGYTIFF